MARFKGGNGADIHRGTNGRDILFGNDGDDELFGLGNADRLDGGNGDDWLYGGEGNDRLTGGNGDDWLDGGDGFDTVSYAAATDPVYLFSPYGQRNVTTGPFGSDNDILYEIESVIGSRFDDVMSGDEGIYENIFISDGTGSGVGYYLSIYRGGGEDRFDGGRGNDVLSGEPGADRLIGGAGDDVIIGGLHRDSLTGGRGSDRFVFASGDSGGVGFAADLITDFSQSQSDRIDLSGLDANRATRGGDALAFIFLGTDRFHGVPGEVWYEHKNGDTFIHVDTTGDAVTDFDLRLTGEIALSASDFVF